MTERPALYGQMGMLQYARSAAEYLLGGGGPFNEAATKRKKDATDSGGGERCLTRLRLRPTSLATIDDDHSG